MQTSSPPPPVSRDEAMDIAYTAVRCAAALVRGDGRFVYKLVDNVPVDEYNLLRHCGTAWSIAHIGLAKGGEVHGIDAAKRSMDMIKRDRMRPFMGGQCVSGGKVTKLGGAGLAILAFVSLDRFDSSKAYLKDALALAKFIMAAQREDGDFDHKFRVKTGDVLPFRSEYYTGEALFGLLELYKRLPEQQELLDCVLNSIEALMPQNYGVKEQSHWMSHALSSLHSITGDPRLVDYAGAISANILADPKYRARRMAAPTSTRVEALMAYGDMQRRCKFETNGPSYSDILRHASHDIAELLKYRRKDGSFRKSETENIVQIDYIQHAALAFLGYHRNHPSLYAAS